MSLLRFACKNVKLNMLVWLFILIYMTYMARIDCNFFARFIGVCTVVILYATIFYAQSLILFPNYWEKWTLLFSMVILSYLIYVLFYYLIEYLFLPVLCNLSRSTQYSLINILKSYVPMFVLILLCSTSFHINRHGRKMLLLQHEKEKILIKKEISYLKTQFNSHLTFNFINFCYSNLYKHSQDAAESMEIFSDMLRYTLTIKPEVKIKLEEEVKYLHNFITIQKLLNPNRKIDYFCKCDLNRSYIIPYILVSFIESAFLGSLEMSYQDSIQIKLHIRNNNLIYLLKYPSLILMLKDEELKNLKEKNLVKILDLFYKNSYQLKKNNKNNIQVYKLKLKL